MIDMLYKNWAKTGFLFSLVILTYIYFFQKNEIALLEKYILLNLAFLMLHQFEEYVYPGKFKDFFNTRLYDPLGFFRHRITDKGIFWVNVVFGWGVNIFVFIFLRTNPVAVMTIIGILFLNGIMHFFVTFKTRYYNPGVITGAIFFIPLGIYSFNKLYTEGLLKQLDVPFILLYVLLCSLMIPITIYACREKRRKLTTA